MLLDRISAQLKQSGYDNSIAGPTGIYIYTKQQEYTRDYIVLVNLPDQLPDDVRGILYGMQQMKYQIDTAQNGRFLFIYLTDEPDKLRMLCEDSVDTHWLLDRSRLQLIIYENQSHQFELERNLIENAMYGKEKRKRFTSYSTAFIVVANVLIFFVMYYKIYFVWGERSKSIFINRVGLFWPEVIYNHQYWRLLSSMFVHDGVEHLMNNMVLLGFAGMYLEEKIGHVKFTLIYFISGILAGLVSMGYNSLNEDLIISIGASGAIYGIVGALACMILLSKDSIGDIRSTRFIIFVGLSLYCGFRTEGVDNIAHVGGFISGFILAWILLSIKKLKRKYRKVDN